MFPVQRPGQDIFLLPIFIREKKTPDIAPARPPARPTGHNFCHPLDRKETFFKGGLIEKKNCFIQCNPIVNRPSVSDRYLLRTVVVAGDPHASVP